MVEVSGYACITTALPSVSIHYSVLKKKCLSYSSTVNIPMITGAWLQSLNPRPLFEMLPLGVSQSLSLSVSQSWLWQGGWPGPAGGCTALLWWNVDGSVEGRSGAVWGRPGPPPLTDLSEPHYAAPACISPVVEVELEILSRHGAGGAGEPLTLTVTKSSNYNAASLTPTIHHLHLHIQSD